MKNINIYSIANYFNKLKYIPKDIINNTLLIK